MYSARRYERSRDLSGDELLTRPIGSSVTPSLSRGHPESMMRPERAWAKYAQLSQRIA